MIFVKLGGGFLAEKFRQEGDEDFVYSVGWK